jgi:DNA-binding response OmpR family regulator
MPVVRALEVTLRNRHARSVFEVAAKPVLTRALVIDDDPSVGSAIQMILNREGCDAVHAPDADMAIKAFEAFSFGLIIVDIFMPGTCGLNTISKFRQREPELPILAMSGFRFRSSMDRRLDFLGMAADAGATVCLRKPFTPHQLMAAVHASIGPESLQRNDWDPARGLLR